ncbi:MAG: SCP2 sterol-binding domain-containing protein [Pseudomonadota bacterium]
MSSEAESLRSEAETCFVAPFGGILRIECAGDGSSLWIDGRGEAPVVSPDAPPEVSGQFCLWRSDVQTLRSIVSQQRRLETAYTAGQIKISGDMAVMARIEIGNTDQ